jgi:homoserine O-acetyltransferase
VDPELFQDNERMAVAQDFRRYARVGAIQCELGGVLENVCIAYETWGELSTSRDNAVLVCHAISGDSHAVGWWDRIVGPGRVLDTDRYFVICTNVLGGCRGSTGPSSLAPDGKPYGSRFPWLTFGDMVEAQRRVVQGLGIERLLLACGGSMGGMQAIEWSLRWPGSVRKVWATAACAAQNAMQIGFNEAGRQAIMRDPKWRNGDYPPDDPPVDGLMISRMMAHLGFLSEQAFEQKFGRRFQDERHPFTEPNRLTEPRPQFAVASYLLHQGSKFAARFDANSFLVLSRALNEYERRTFEPDDADAPRDTQYLFTSFASDWLYPPHQSEALYRMAVDAGFRSRWVNVDLPYGHDAFLLDGVHQAEAVRQLLSDPE